MAKIHVSLSYHHIHLDVLDVFGVGVRNGIFGNNPPFVASPLTQPQLQLLIDNYINKRGAYVQGGLAQKGLFLASKTALIAGLDSVADYVDVTANGDANIITLAGFVPTSPGGIAGHAPLQSAAPQLKRGASGEMFAEIPVVAGADNYGCIVFAGMPMPSQISLNAVGQLVVANTKDANPNPIQPEPPIGIVAFFDLNKNRKKKFVGLQPHVVYYFYFYTSNASGVSPLSVVSSLECL